MSTNDLLVRNVHLATMVEAGEPYGALEDGALAVRGGRISWLGPATEIPAGAVDGDAVELDGEGGWLTPGLVDCHTHAVFGGSRATEFEERLRGATYEEIAGRGGGILATVRSTRAADEDALEASAVRRLRTLQAEGVTTMEIKSGYGLDVDTELRMLRAARRLGERLPLSVSTTLLGAHALPPELSDDRGRYLDMVCEEMIPRAHDEGLADAVDAFCEGIAFTPEECARVFDAAAQRGLARRLHADQLSDLGGAALAARHGARSADHLEHASEAGVAAMARAGTTAVLLPGAFYFLGGGPVPPVALFRTHGVPIAVATDLNPGSSPLLSPLMALNMACVLFGLTPEEALAGMTRNAAPVLGMEEEIGALERGKRGDLVLWEVDHPSELSYWMGAGPCRAVVHGGRVLDT